MRKLVKFERNENTINMRVYDKITKKSENFYLLNAKIQDALDGKSIIDRDIFSYCSMHRRENILNIRMDWLQGVGNFELKGYTERFCIDAEKLESWFKGEEKNYTCITVNDNKTAKFDIRCEKTIKDILSNRTMRKKFAKGIQRLMCWQGEKIELYDDWVDYSFYFVEKDKNNNRVMNGGLIFHKDYDEKDNLKKGYYSIHT